MMMVTMMMVTMRTVTMMMVMIITKTTTGIPPDTNVSRGRGLHHDDHHISVLKFGPYWTGQTSGGGEVA